MATAVVDSVVNYTSNDKCVICLVPNPSIRQTLFECNHSSAFCAPCHYRAAIHLDRCPLCRSERKLTLPKKVHITELVKAIDKTAPKVSYRFLANLSASLVKKVERIYSLHRNRGPTITVDPQHPNHLHVSDIGGVFFLRVHQQDEPNALSMAVADDEAVANMAPDNNAVTLAASLESPLLHGWILSCGSVFDGAIRDHDALSDHPVITLAPRNKPLRRPVYFVYPADDRLLRIYVNWLTHMYYGDRQTSGPLQCWMITAGVLEMTDSPREGQSQKNWANALVAQQLDILNHNAINVTNALRWRESAVICRESHNPGIYGCCDPCTLNHWKTYRVRHMQGPFCPVSSTSVMARVEMGIPLSQGLQYVAGPYAFAVDMISMAELARSFTPPGFWENPPHPKCRGNAKISMKPDCYSLTQVLRHPSMGDTSLKVVRFFNAKGLQRVVYRLACRESLVATAIRVCGNTPPVCPNANPDKKSDDGYKKLDTEEHFADLDFEQEAKEESVLISSNVSLMDVEIVASNPETYIYKVASATSFPNPDNISINDYLPDDRLPVVTSFPLALVKLWVPPTAKIAIHPNDSKVRVSSAHVVAIVPVLKRVGNGTPSQVYSMELAAEELREPDANNTNVKVTYSYGKPISTAHNFYHQPNTMEYVTYSTVSASDFTNDLDIVCVPGIHGFTSQAEAIGYGICTNPDKINADDIDGDSWDFMDKKTIAMFE